MPGWMAIRSHSKKIFTGGRERVPVWTAVILVTAGVALAVHQDQCRFGLANVPGEGVQQGENCGVSERDSQGNGSRDGKADHEDNQ
jgi:hypothetical protein